MNDQHRRALLLVPADRDGGRIVFEGSPADLVAAEHLATYSGT